MKESKGVISILFLMKKIKNNSLENHFSNPRSKPYLNSLVRKGKNKETSYECFKEINALILMHTVSGAPFK